MSDLKIMSQSVRFSNAARNANRQVFTGTTGSSAQKQAQHVSQYVPTMQDVVDFLRFRFGAKFVEGMQKNGILTKKAIEKLSLNAKLY